jgi:predicted Zn-dependent protease
MKTLRKISWKILALNLVLALSILSGCYTVPETGRRSLVLIDEPTEIQMGLSAYAQMKTEKPISTDPEYNRQVRQVGMRIAAVANKPNYEWEFTVFDAPDTLNAWCLPGGKIGVYTGLFKVVENEPQLATVIAHEVGHAIAKHGAERVSHGLILAVGSEAIAASMEDETEEDVQKIEQMKVSYGIASSLFVMLPFSRKHEYEADRIGLILMAKAGYDPRAALELWKKFAAYKDEQGKTTIEYLSTHPSDEKRIAQIQKFMPDALQHYYRATGTEPPPVEIDEGAEIPKAKVNWRGTGGQKRKTFIGVKLQDDE